MFAQATIRLDDRTAVLAVPRGAILDDGRSQYVLRAFEDGRFQPVRVSTGRRGEEWVAVDSSLAEGERIAISAQFLIDAESNLQSELERLRAMSDAEADPMAGMHHGR
jgi:Cu(I)/Ag(I) efflux system membrane fusion protein